ncbi:MAG TPA: ABC transporter substrate-binding protein [Acidimicrobiales bacterium]|jgi:ABC-type nitrate/sulfonate/bicarbonate transport system substrate-binding protein|nr:ABC transporter substrate-binding protein [Acidimicrobiales bacterium]
MTIAFSFLPNVEYAGWILAQQNGWYRDYDLDITLVGGGPNAPTPEAQLTAGTAQVATEANTVRLFSALAQGQPLVIFAQDYQQSPNGLLSLRRRPVTTPAELEGARIIASAPNAPSIAALMKINHVKNYTFVPGGITVDGLLAGQGDALLAFAYNQPLTLELHYGMREGKDFFFTPFSKLNYDILSDVSITTRSYRDHHREALVKLVAANIRGWTEDIKFPLNGTNATMREFGASQGLNRAQQEKANKIQASYVVSRWSQAHGLLSLNPGYIQDSVYRTLRASGITNLPALEHVIDTSIVADAWKLVGKANRGVRGRGR